MINLFQPSLGKEELTSIKDIDLVIRSIKEFYAQL